jgi:hypothetical protein
MVIIFSLCWLLIIHHIQNGYFFTSLYVFPISAGFQLTLFPRVKQAESLIPLCLQTGSRKLWIQATAQFFVGHSSFCIDFIVDISSCILNGGGGGGKPGAGALEEAKGVELSSKWAT